MRCAPAGTGCKADVVESFVAGGRFWLPQTPGRRVPGELAFDDTGIQLQVTESLHGPLVRPSGACGGPMQWVSEPVVHGLLRSSEEVTLLQGQRPGNSRGRGRGDLVGTVCVAGRAGG